MKNKTVWGKQRKSSWDKKAREIGTLDHLLSSVKPRNIRPQDIQLVIELSLRLRSLGTCSLILAHCEPIYCLRAQGESLQEGLVLSIVWCSSSKTNWELEKPRVDSSLAESYANLQKNYRWQLCGSSEISIRSAILVTQLL